MKTTSNRENYNQATQSLFFFSFLSSKSNAFFFILKHEGGIWFQE